MNVWIRETAAPFLALFASLSTLLCCALPALLITVGAGAVMAGLATDIPGYIWLTEQKAALFITAGILLCLATSAKYVTRNAPCPADPALARACKRSRRFGTLMLCVAFPAYLIGGFFAFFAADLLL